MEVLTNFPIASNKINSHCDSWWEVYRYHIVKRREEDMTSLEIPYCKFQRTWEGNH